MPEGKFCVNCRHRRVPFSPFAMYDNSQCGLELVESLDPVRGDPVFLGPETSCREERATLSFIERIFGTGRCGPEGRFFEAGQSRFPNPAHPPPPRPER